MSDGFLNQRSRAWCFTWNNYPDDAVDLLKALECCRLIAGKEVAPTTGTPHLQGYIRFHQPKKGSWWKKHFPKVSARVANGTDSQNEVYCSKDGEIVINFGVNYDRSVEKGLSRAEEADMVMEEIDKGATWGQVRSKHRQFCFWNRTACLKWGQDNEKIRHHYLTDESGFPLTYGDFR